MIRARRESQARRVGRVERAERARDTRRKNINGNIRQVPADQVAVQCTVQAVVQGALQAPVQGAVQAAVVSVTATKENRRNQLSPPLPPEWPLHCLLPWSKRTTRALGLYRSKIFLDEYRSFLAYSRFCKKGLGLCCIVVTNHPFSQETGRGVQEQ